MRSARCRRVSATPIADPRPDERRRRGFLMQLRPTPPPQRGRCSGQASERSTNAGRCGVSALRNRSPGSSAGANRGSCAGPVRHFVVEKALGSESLVDQLILVCLVVVVRMSTRLTCERRARLDSEAVGGYVWRFVAQCALDGLFLVAERLSCGPVDEVEVERRQAHGTHRFDCSHDVLAVVSAA